MPLARRRHLTRQTAALTAAIALWFGYMVWRVTGAGGGAWGADLAALFLAGHFHATGQDALIYALSPGVFGQTPQAWFATLRDMGATGPAYPYVYPPIWAILVAPLTKLLTLQQFFNLFGILHAAALTGTLLLARALLLRLPKALPPHALTAALLAAALLAYPVPSAIYFNQPTALTAVLTLLALHRIVGGHPVQAGLALGLAAALKLTPAAFVLVFVLDRNWRALAAFCATAFVLAAANLAWAPDLTQTFLDTLPLLGAHSSIARVNTSLLPALYSIGSALHLLPALPAGPQSPLLGPNGLPIPVILAVIPKLAAVIALGFGSRALRGLPRETRLVGAGLLIGLIVPLFGPLGWQHYYIVPLLLVPMLAPALRPARAAIGFGALLLGGAPALITWVPALARSIPAHQAVLTGLWLAVLVAAIALLPRLAPALPPR